MYPDTLTSASGAAWTRPHRVRSWNIRRKTRNGFYETLADVSCLTEEQMLELLDQLRKDVPLGAHNARERAKQLIEAYKAKYQ